MKWVYLVNNAVHEVIPDYAIPPDEWYGTEFASHCVEALDEVEQGWVYIKSTNMFTKPPSKPEPEPIIDPEDDRDSMLIDHEFRLTLIELGV